MVRDESYDFIKGVAILAVILHHFLTFTFIATTRDVQYLLGHAVPVFLTLTIFFNYKHFYEKGEVHINILELIKKLVFPFFISQVITIPIAFKYGIPYESIIKSFGCGAGTYYLLIYFQILVLCRFIIRLFEKNWIVCGCVLLVTHILFEILFRYFEVPEYVYRVVCTRYLFLFFIAYLLYRLDLLVKYIYVFVFFAIVGIALQYVNCKYDNHLGLFPSEAFISQKFYTNFTTLFIILLLKKIYGYIPCRTIIVCGRKSNILFIIQLTIFPAFLYFIEMYVHL